MPLDIPRLLLQKFGKKNDIWYDCYMGTGTTALACVLEKRNYIGSEISKEYCDIANTRIEPEKNQTKIF
jgi:DNA modification methylase